jgi:hypothetical protein
LHEGRRLRRVWCRATLFHVMVNAETYDRSAAGSGLAGCEASRRRRLNKKIA